MILYVPFYALIPVTSSLFFILLAGSSFLLIYIPFLQGILILLDDNLSFRFSLCFLLYLHFNFY